MRVIAILLGVLCLTQSMTVPNQGQLQESRSRIEKLLTSLVEVAAYSNQFNFSKLFQAIDDLTAGLREAEVQEDALYDREYKEFVEDDFFYSDLVTYYTGEVAQYTEELRSLNNHLTSYEEQLETKKQELSETSAQKAVLEEQIRQNEIIYKSALAEFNSAIDVIDQALQLLQSLRDNPSFLQTNSEQLSQVGQQLHQLNFQHHRVLYQPIVEVLLEMAQSKLADQDLLKKVLKHLQELRNSLDGGRNMLTSQYNAARESNLKLVEQYQAKIDLLTKTLIPQLQDLIVMTIDQIKVKTNLLNDSQANLAEAEGLLKQLRDRWSRRTVQHKALMKEYETELALIADAVKTLASGGIRRE